MLKPPLDSESLRILFTKPYGQPGPTAGQWKAVYAEDVVFIDPTQEKRGVESYIRAQDGLMRRCDDVFLETESVAINNDVAFVEWRMGLKIKGIEFIYPGATRLRFDGAGKIVHHRDYFDFVGPTFEPVPVLGGFVRWLYKRFVS
tara:strand:+ start:1564 stop:1998 length:435 start_codon:yes stop_codon:yes gene_type:complete